MTTTSSDPESTAGGRRRTVLSLMLIALLSAGISTTWLFQVPFMQETDEQAHADYAYALYDAHGWFVARHSRPEDYVTAQVRYLAAKSNFWSMRLSADARAPAGYGSKAYYSALDRGAPSATASKKRGDPSAVPYVAYSYPPGYYVVAAAAMRVAAFASHGSLVATYFAARALGVVFLTLTVLLAFATLRVLAFSNARALWLSLAIGIMPLASWVSSYIQPDSLVMLLATLVVYLSVTWRTRPFDRARSSLLLLALGATYFVKPHYALALTVGAGSMVLAYVPIDRSRAAKRSVAVALGAALLAVAWLAAITLTPTGAFATPPVFSAIQPGGSTVFASAARFAGYLIAGTRDAYAGGQAFETFWFSYGDLVSPYIRWPVFASVTQAAFAVLSLTVTVLLAIRQARVAGRLAKVFGRHRTLAIRLVFGDAVLNIYIAWTALLLSVFAASGGQVYLEGRYFLPILLPTVLLGVKYLPRVVARKARSKVSLALTAGWVTYGVVASVLALSSMHFRFYGAPHDKGPTRLVEIIRIATNEGDRIDKRDFSLRPQASVRVDGVAVSLKHSLPLQGISATLDGRTIPVSYKYRHAVRYGEGADSFSLRTPPSLAFGHHVLRIAPRPAVRGDGNEKLEIDVTS